MVVVLIVLVVVAVMLVLVVGTGGLEGLGGGEADEVEGLAEDAGEGDDGRMPRAAAAFRARRRAIHRSSRTPSVVAMYTRQHTRTHHTNNERTPA